MSVQSRESRSVDPGVRRVRYALMSGVLLVSVTVVCVVASVLASAHRLRFDATATREHALSERTLSVLASLESPHRIVVSANVSTLDPRARLRVADVIEEISRASNRVDSSWIDTGSAGGYADFGSLLGEMSDLRSAEIDLHVAAVESVSAALEDLHGLLPSLEAQASRATTEVPSMVTEASGAARQIASLARTFSEQLPAMNAIAEQCTMNEIAGVALPASDIAARQLAPRLEAFARAMDSALETLEHLSGEQARATMQLGEQSRDISAAAADAIDRLEPLVPLVIARAIEVQDVVIVISERSVTAIEFASMFPDSSEIDARGAGQASISFSGEELVASALAALNARVSPLLIFVHPETTPLLTSDGAPTSVARRAFATLLDRLRLRGIDVREWAVALDDDALPPRIDGADERPGVWLVFPSPTAVPSASRTESQASRHERIERLGGAVRTLLERGENVLVNINTSELPTIGEADPVASALAPLGLRIETGRPLLRRQAGPGATLISTSFAFDRAILESPIGASVRGLRVVLPWVSPIVIDGLPDGVTAQRILQVEASPDVWGESSWQALRLANYGRPLEPLALADPPQADAGRDLDQGPWLAACAVERIRGATGSVQTVPARSSGPQRLVVVASPNWFTDAFLSASEQIAGRRVWLFPGNAELLDSAISWLAGQDELIAPSPRTRDIPRIAALDASQVRLIRWTLIAGIPIAVLLLGVGVRLLRR